MNIQEYLSKLYSNRFDSSQKYAKVLLWKVLIKEFLQQHVGRDAVVLDIGGGYCEFINHIQARGKYLIDLNPDAKLFADPDVKVFNLNILEFEQLEFQDVQFDRIFISNFFEHLNNKEELIQILLFCFNSLKPGGALLIIQPNFKYSFREYYDFIDHQLPITHISLQEVLQTLGFKIDLMIPRFLPFSTKGRPSSPQLLRLYLNLPILWKFLGGQLFVKASKPFRS